MNFIKNQKGFTLVEMLIVISIIAILAGVFLTGLGGFRGSANDTKKLADLQKIASYLELYYNKVGSYPAEAGWVNTLQTTVKVTVPTDPAQGYQYGQCPNNAGWVVAAYVSSPELVKKDYPSQGVCKNPGTATCNGTNNWYCVVN